MVVAAAARTELRLRLDDALWQDVDESVTTTLERQLVAELGTVADPAIDELFAGAPQHSYESFVDAMLADGVTKLTPATVGPAPDPSTTGDAVFNAPWTYAGVPTVSLPIGRTSALNAGNAKTRRRNFATARSRRRVGFCVIPAFNFPAWESGKPRLTMGVIEAGNQRASAKGRPGHGRGGRVLP